MRICQGQGQVEIQDLKLVKSVKMKNFGLVLALFSQFDLSINGKPKIKCVVFNVCNWSHAAGNPFTRNRLQITKLWVEICWESDEAMRKQIMREKCGNNLFKIENILKI